MKTELLNATDIFDFYGCEYLYNSISVEKADRKKAEGRIHQVYEKYMSACRARIKAEMKFIGVDSDVVSFRSTFKVLEEMLYSEIDKQAESMMSGLGGFNLMKMVIEANKAAGNDVSDVEGMFGTTKSKGKKQSKHSINAESMLKDPKWHIIAKAFIALEDAKSTKDIVQAIDHLNDLQHNSFHLLIDLQTGRMLESKSTGDGYGKHEEAVKVVKEVLDLKKEAKSPKEFADKMSEDIRAMYHEYRFI